MCIIIHKPAGATLALSTVLRGYQRNDDGWGLIARTPAGLVVQRDFGRDADASLLDAFDSLRAHELTIHCRIGTSGNASIINTHPFNVVGDLWMVHNGVINIDRSADTRYCDSYHVAAALGKALGAPGVDPHAALRDTAYLKALTDYAKTSKLVFVDPHGVVIVNEQLGHWHDGCWFSNDSADIDYQPYSSWSASAWQRTPDATDNIDDAAFDERADSDDRYDPIEPRCFRIETPEDEDAIYLDALAFLDACQKLDVDDIAERCLRDPEIAAEALYVLLQERFTPATILR